LVSYVAIKKCTVGYKHFIRTHIYKAPKIAKRVLE